MGDRWLICHRGGQGWGHFATTPGTQTLIDRCRTHYWTEKSSRTSPTTPSRKMCTGEAAEVCGPYSTTNSM
jgi:hypothetical protein